MLGRCLAVSIVCALILGSVPATLAQQPTSTPALDRRGKPLPFGVQPYFKPDVPLGSGPYKAIMAQEDGLPDQVAYYPADLSRLGAKKLPIVVWGNGACINAGNRFRQFLTEIASHGYLVISGGSMADKEFEVGPQENPVPRQAAAPQGQRGGPPAQDPANPPGRVTVPILKRAIDWALEQNASSASRFHGMLDPAHVVVMGQSCGGSLAVQLAVDDARVTGLGVWNSGAGLGSGTASTPIRARTRKAAPFSSSPVLNHSISHLAAVRARSNALITCPCSTVGARTCNTLVRTAHQGAASWDRSRGSGWSGQPAVIRPPPRHSAAPRVPCARTPRGTSARNESTERNVVIGRGRRGHLNGRGVTSASVSPRLHFSASKYM